jgi:preprotein translocase subunit SecE
MARDRQRAKQRKARRAQQGDGAKPPEKPVDDFQGPLGQIGEHDVAEAAIVAGAGGEVAEPGSTDDVAGVEHPEELSDSQFAELEDRVDDVEQAMEDGDQAEVDELEHELDEESRKAGPPAKAAPAGAPTKRGPARFAAFLRASWAELQRVQWPDRRQVGQATAVVLGFVVIAGIYLGLADALAQQIVDWII